MQIRGVAVSATPIFLDNRATFFFASFNSQFNSSCSIQQRLKNFFNSDYKFNNRRKIDLWKRFVHGFNLNKVKLIVSNLKLFSSHPFLFFFF